MTKQVIDEDTQNEKILSEIEGDFDTFLRDRDFYNAQAIIDNLCDMDKYTKAGELLIRLTAAKMRVPADYGFQKETQCEHVCSSNCRREGCKCACEGEFHEDDGGPEYDKYSTREYYERTEAEFGSPF